MVSQVVVRDARVRVDDLRGAVRELRVDPGCHEHRGVAQRTRVEDRRDLADDALLEQSPHAHQYLRFGDASLGCDVLVGARGDREAALHEVEQSPVQLVQRHRRALAAAAQLGPGGGRASAHRRCAIHRAASFAW